MCKILTLNIGEARRRTLRYYLHYSRYQRCSDQPDEGIHDLHQRQSLAEIHHVSNGVKRVIEGICKIQETILENQ